MELAHELAVAIDLARRAGAAVLTHYQVDVQVDYKGGNHSNPVTAADRVANELIVAGLRQAFPADAVLAEESVADTSRFDARRLWCVDPLDGTQEFIAHNGQFVVMIGLAIDGEARLGVVFAPTAGRLYWGVPGRAESPAGVESSTGPLALAVSRTSEPQQAIMVVSRSHRSKTVSAIAEALHLKAQRPLGSVGLKAAEVASGAAELYISMSDKTHEWDACAPEAIVRAAGGLMTDVVGEPLRYNKPHTHTPHGLLATNGALHAAAVAAIRPYAKERGLLA